MAGRILRQVFDHECVWGTEQVCAAMTDVKSTCLVATVCLSVRSLSQTPPPPSYS